MYCWSIWGRKQLLHEADRMLGEGSEIELERAKAQDTQIGYLSLIDIPTVKSTAVS